MLERVKRLAPSKGPAGTAQRYTCFTEGVENSVVLVGLRRAVETLRNISEELNRKGNLRLALPPRCAMIEKWGASGAASGEDTPMQECLLDSDDDRDRQLTMVLFLDPGAPASPERCHDLRGATVEFAQTAPSLPVALPRPLLSYTDETRAKEHYQIRCGTKELSTLRMGTLET